MLIFHFHVARSADRFVGLNVPVLVMHRMVNNHLPGDKEVKYKLWAYGHYPRHYVTYEQS